MPGPTGYLFYGAKIYKKFSTLYRKVLKIFKIFLWTYYLRVRTIAAGHNIFVLKVSFY